MKQDAAKARPRATILSRRRLLAVSALAACAVPLPLLAASRAPIPTPRQTAGPFYPDRLPADRDSDLVRIAGRAGEAAGEILGLEGRVLTRDGHPVAGARIEIWQVDAQGRYLAERDRGPDPDFQGYGASQCDAGGRYSFRTIRPVAYTGRTPHIHIRVHHPDGRELTTQMYLAGEPGNARDFLYRRLSPEEQAALTATLRPAAASGYRWQTEFDLVFA
ncbi:MAG: intradiol ring-cleavage dioxygenase [Alphaproteobacteria bacterium]|nr:intradiol ring-cleavage dioxygenase [Alphaproteobacteria bacterium]